MGKHLVGHVNEIQDGEIKVVELKGKSIGVYYSAGNFYSMLNFCPHQGGPLCEGGKLFPTISAEIDNRGRVKEFHDNERIIVSCPWHGWEFDAKTGRCLADERRRARTFETKVVDDQVYVVLPD